MKHFEIPIFHMEDGLTDQQRSFFHKYGFIQFKGFISKERVTLFLKEIEEVQEFLLRTEMKKINGIPLKFGTDINGRQLIQRLAFTSLFSKTLSAFLKNDQLKPLLELLGPHQGRIAEDEKDGLVFNHYLRTPSSQFSQLGWHTDSPRDLFLGSRILPMLNIGLHLDDCPSHYGGLRVIPGTHHQGLFRLLFRKKYFIDNKPDKKEMGFDIDAGDLTVHDGRLWHRVQESTHWGEASRRRVLYFPVITGLYQPKHASSPTPFYHRLGQIKLSGNTGKLSWVKLRMKTAKKVSKLS
jgi:phytanoyl-CoA hydroxylase